MPLIRHVGARTALGLALLLCAVAAVGSALHAERTWEAFAVPVGVWLVATLLTDKYRHKYPQRYLTYLLASHLKAAVVMAILLGLASLLAGPATLPRECSGCPSGSSPRRTPPRPPVPAGGPGAAAARAAGRGPAKAGSQARARAVLTYPP